MKGAKLFWPAVGLFTRAGDFEVIDLLPKVTVRLGGYVIKFLRRLLVNNEDPLIFY